MSPGSSPLARGTLSRGRALTRRRGLIPARAGNTGARRCLCRRLGAHPRSRGEHICREPRFKLPWGSSPLARGTLWADRRKPQPTGLIPARAGNTHDIHIAAETGGAHPRSRGEHSISTLYQFVKSGSSPLARGTRHQHPIPPRFRGLIPARAGNTFSGVS